MKKKLLLFLIALHGLILSQAQVSEIKPAKPLTAEAVEIVYDATSPLATLNAKESIYARITCFLQDGAFEKVHQQLANKQGKFVATVKLPISTASAKIEFYTLNKDDDSSVQNLMVYQKDRKTPIKGAYMERFFSNEFDRVFVLETTNHPDNYLAFARYINIVAMTQSPEAAKEKIEPLLQLLGQKLSAGNNSVGLLAALCIGYTKVGQLPTAKKYMFDMFQKYPMAAETAFSFGIYNYINTSKGQIEDDVKAELKRIFMQFPKAAICQDGNVFECLKSDITIPIGAFENVMAARYENGQIPYHALGTLPELLIDRRAQLQLAEKLLLDAIKAFDEGTIQHQYRLNNSHYQTYVPFFHYDLAKIYSLTQKKPLAITHLSAALQIVAGSNYEGNFSPMMLKLRATAYTEMGNYNLAMADYQQLYRIGNLEVLDSLKKFFPLVNVKQKTFNAYLASLKPSGTSQTSPKDLLPNFKGVDLEGKEVTLSQLKGKLVVLNVWGIGCGPCIAEMPTLNALVKEYKNNPNVVFVAITGDNRKDLLNFFKSKSFDYKIVAEVKGITEIFNTNAIPVHMVIGKNGEIINRSIGARQDIQVYLKGVIDGNL